MPNKTTPSIKFVRVGGARSKKRPTAKGLSMGNKGRPRRKAAVPRGCPNNPEAGCGSVVEREK